MGLSEQLRTKILSRLDHFRIVNETLLTQDSVKFDLRREQ